MHIAILTAIKDLRRVLRDPVGLLTWIAMPAVITALVSLISTGTPKPTGTLLIVDHDQSFLSSALGTVFTRDPLDQMVKVERLDMDAARKQIDAGDASALLEIPKGFGDAVLNRKDTKLTLLVNPGQRIVPKVIEEVLDGVLDAGFYAQTSLGANFNASADMVRTTEAIRVISRRASTYVDPPLIHLETTVTGEKKKQISFPALFFPGMLILAIFGLGQSLSLDWWAERTAGTLRRAIVAPAPMYEFVAGKTASIAVLSGGIGILGMVVSRWVLSAPSENMFVAVLWIAASGVALYLMNSLAQMPAADQRSGLVVNQFAFFLLSMIGGSFFPFEMMPTWLANIGRWTPNGFAISHFKQITTGAIDAANIELSFLYLLLFIGAEFLLLSRRTRRWAV